MENKKPKSILVVFGKELPKKGKKWFKRFDKIITKDELEKLIGTGSVQKAYELVNDLSRLATSSGSRLSKSVNWHGYELWWLHYDSLYDNFCLPYTQYGSLLSLLKDFKNVYLFQPPHANLFRYFLKAHGCQCFILSDSRLRKLLPIPLGVVIQLILSVVFLPWLMVRRPKLMVFTSDKFDSSNDYDFRYKFIYEELRKRRIPFVEFIRSLEPWSVILQHAWRRKRPVIYSAAIIYFIYSLAGLFAGKKISAEGFWPRVANHYIRNVRGTIFSICLLKFILKLIGIKSAIITTGCDRTFHELLACKSAEIKTIGIQHGAQMQNHNIYDFMPEFDGPKKLSLDQYGLWSEWWRKYFIDNSRAFYPEQLFVAGPMRPLMGERQITVRGTRQDQERLRVLYISEGLAVPAEVLPYILTILEIQDFELHFKFRPYRDMFELWLKEQQPEIYKKISERAKILRGTMEEAMAQCDVAVGSHSNAVLEALLQLKPFVFFRTQKWGDYFEIKSFDDQDYFFAENPQELIEKIRGSVNVPKEDLRELQERFYGDPYQNGSQWVVDQAEKFSGALKFSKQKQN